MKRIFCWAGIVTLLVALAFIVKKIREDNLKKCGCAHAKEEKEADMADFAQGGSIIVGSTILLLMVVVGGLIALVVYAVGSTGKAIAQDTEGTLDKVDRGLDTAQKAKTVIYR